MRFSDIQAQETAVRILVRSISSPTHAYLFTGPEGTGKTTTALAFAAALNCPDGGCGACLACERIHAGTDPDVRLIAPDGNQTKIDQMHEMIREMNYSPLSGKYKVIIIEQADTLNSHSENCILKILEEPPSYAVLVLLSRNPNSLLSTIRSRCRTVRFTRASIEQVEAALAPFDLPDDERRVIAACSRGAVGTAFAMARNPEIMAERRTVLNMLKSWAEGPSIVSLQAAEILREQAKPPKNNPEGRTLTRNLLSMLEHVLAWHADLLALKIRPDARIVNIDFAEDLAALANRYDAAKLRAGVRRIMETRRYLDGNITPQLALETMFLNLHPEA
ncbi:MAG: DNA polymerase III subunit [Armatimonadota bacterium]